MIVTIRHPIPHLRLQSRHASFQKKRILPSEFDSLRGEWNALLRRSAMDSVFLRWEWMRTWWDIFNRNRKLFILTIRFNDRLVGLAPFYIEWGPLGAPRTLKVCSDELSPDYLAV